jgi:hypothetical protein
MGNAKTNRVKRSRIRKRLRQQGLNEEAIAMKVTTKEQQRNYGSWLRSTLDWKLSSALIDENL